MALSHAIGGAENGRAQAWSYRIHLKFGMDADECAEEVLALLRKNEPELDIRAATQIRVGVWLCKRDPNAYIERRSVV